MRSYHLQGREKGIKKTRLNVINPPSKPIKGCEKWQDNKYTKHVNHFLVVPENAGHLCMTTIQSLKYVNHASLSKIPVRKMRVKKNHYFVVKANKSKIRCRVKYVECQTFWFSVSSKVKQEENVLLSPDEAQFRPKTKFSRVAITVFFFIEHFRLWTILAEMEKNMNVSVTSTSTQASSNDNVTSGKSSAKENDDSNGKSYNAAFTCAKTFSSCYFSLKN